MRPTIIIVVEHKRRVWLLRKCWEICDYITCRWIKYNDGLAVYDNFDQFNYCSLLNIYEFLNIKFTDTYAYALMLSSALMPYYFDVDDQLLTVCASTFKHIIKWILYFNIWSPNCILLSICTTKNIQIGM